MDTVYLDTNLLLADGGHVAHHVHGRHVPGEDDEALPDVHSLAPDPVVAGDVDQADGRLVGDHIGDLVIIIIIIRLISQ